MTEHNNIELRSEKVRNIIGKVPPELVMGGTAYVAFLLFALFVAAALIPYPENIRTKVTVTYKDNKQIGMEALIPYRYINRIGKGTDINVEMEGFPAQKYGSQHGTIKIVEDSLISRNQASYFRVYLMMEAPFKYDMKWNMQGIATITLIDKSILQYMLWK